MNLKKALILELERSQKPVITPYQLGVIFFELIQVQEKVVKNISELDNKQSLSGSLRNLVEQLKDLGVLRKVKGLPSNVFMLLGKSDVDVIELACSLDPFCYISHLSAMDFHGLTNRIPHKLFLSTPSRSAWRTAAKSKMLTDLKENYDAYIQTKLPLLTQIPFDRIKSTDINWFNTSHLGAYKNIRGGIVRVSTIGRLFLEMLRQPNLCGGMAHVLEVYEEHARSYLKLIVNEIDSHGTNIDKVRAGYILNERLSINHPTIESWKEFVQRGGSRKLDPESEYASTWSDTWSLSLNVLEYS